MLTLHTIKLSNAICCAMQLDDPGMRQEFGFPKESFRMLKSGLRFTGTLDDLEKLARHMSREDGWDISPSLSRACNKRAAEIVMFVKEQRAGKDLP